MSSKYQMLGQRRHHIAWATLGIVVGLITGLATVRAQVTSTWVGGAGNWSDPLKWSSDPNFPNNGNGGFTYDAIISSGAVTLDQDIVIEDLTLSGGTISGTGNLLLNDLFSWSGPADLIGSGTTTIAVGGTLNVTQGNSQTLGRNLVNNGTSTWSSTANNNQWHFINATITNNHLFTLNTTANQIFANTSGNNNFNNAGTFTKIGGGSGTVNIPFHNSGTVDVQAGTLSLQGGGSHSGNYTGSTGTTLRLGGSHSFAVGADITGGLDVIFDSGGTSTYNGALSTTGGFLATGGTNTVNGAVSVVGASFSGGSTTFNDSFNPGGSLTLSGGTANLGTNSLSLSTFNLSGGTLLGSGNMSVVGTMIWSGPADLIGSGTTTIAVGGTLNVTQGNSQTLGRNLVNNGTSTWSSTANNNQWHFINATITNNHLFTLNTTANQIFANTSGNNNFNNAGTFTKIGGGSGTVNIPFHNSGTVDVQAGTLTLNGPNGLQTGQFNVGANGVLNFDSSFTPQITSFGPTSTFTGSGEVQFRSGTFPVDNAGSVDNFTIHQTTVIDATLSLTGNENFDSIDLHNGTLDHVSNVDINGTLWVNSSGTLRGAGRTDANASHIVNGLLDIRTGHQFRSVGAGIVKPNKEVSIYSGGRWDVLPAGTVDFQGSNTISGPDSTGYMLNQGTITKTGDGVTDVGVQFENDGLLHVQEAARWDLRKSANHGGTFDLDVDTGLRLRSGSTHTFLAGSEIIGDGELQLVQGSTAVIQGNLDVGRIVIEGDSTLDMQVDGGVGTLELNNGAVAGQGALNIWNTLRFVGDAELAKSLILNSDTPSAILTNSLQISLGGNILSDHVGVLQNDGTITRTGGGTSTIELNVNNFGRMQISGGSGLQFTETFGQFDGQFVVDGEVIFGDKAEFSGGSVSGSGTISAPNCGPLQLCIDVAGAINAGNSPGHLSIDGGMGFKPSASYEVELAGTSQGITYDLLSVTGAVDLNGALTVMLLNDFTPQLNDTFEVLTAGSITGQFASAQLPALSPGLRWNVQYEANSVNLLVEAGIAGDFNNDQHVDAADYAYWRKYFNNDQIKYSQWRANFGQAFSSGSNLSSEYPIPEPSLMASFLISMVTLAGFRRRSESAAWAPTFGNVLPLHHKGFQRHAVWSCKCGD